MSSDTSSAYSGSDTMQSVPSGTDEVDLSGLHESVVDSDEEDLAESIDSLTLRDTVRDCLEKDPADRSDEDIEIILEFTHSLEAFADMSLAVRRVIYFIFILITVNHLADLLFTGDVLRHGVRCGRQGGDYRDERP